MDEMFESLSLAINSITETPEHIREIMSRVKDRVDQESIEHTVGSTLEELVSLGPGEYQRHPSINKIFKWLADPSRTPQEFNYVVGPMGRIEWDWSGHFKNLYLGLVAAEALATRNPVLNGEWRYAAWLVLWLNSEYRKEYNYGIPSDNLCNWIIRVMGEPSICPNWPLRLEFMVLFGRMVTINRENGTKALNAITSVCNTCSLNDGKVVVFLLSGQTSIDLNTLITVLEKLSVYLLALDKYLSRMLNAQVSNIIRDVSYSYGLHPNRYTGQQELETVIWFFRMFTLFMAREHEKYEESQIYPGQENSIEDVTDVMLLLVTNFKKSCQTYRLADLTAACVMGVFEFVLEVNIDLMNQKGKMYPKTLYTTHLILTELCDETSSNNIVLTPVGKLLNSYKGHRERLSILRNKLGKYQPESDMICSLLYHCNLIELRNY